MAILNKNIISVIDNVPGTSTNTEGYILFLLMDKVFSIDGKITLSLKSCTPMSSSFLNSSFGALIEKYGFEKMKGRLVITDYTPVMADNIKNYLSSFQKIAC